MRSGRYLVGLFSLSILVLAVTGCSGKTAAPPLGEIPHVTSVDQLSRPIDSWLPTMGQVNSIIKATGVVAAQCMRNYGFDYHLDEKEVDPIAEIDRGETFGYFNPSTVGEKGYDAVIIGTSTEVDAKPGESVVFSGRDNKGAPVKEYAGKSLPEGGCYRFAQNAVGDVPKFSPQELPDGGPKIPLTDPRLTSVIKSWSECMKVAGFSYGTPAEAFLDPRWRTRESGYKHTSLEISVATADSNCKISSNLMGVVVALEAAYDLPYIKSHVSVLEALKRKCDSQASKASAIIASSNA